MESGIQRGPILDSFSTLFTGLGLSLLSFGTIIATKMPTRLGLNRHCGHIPTHTAPLIPLFHAHIGMQIKNIL